MGEVHRQRTCIGTAIPSSQYRASLSSKKNDLIPTRTSKARAGTNRVRSTLALGLRPCSWKIPCRLSFPRRRACKDFGIDDIARGTLRVGDDLVENIGKLEFILVARDIPDVRRADGVFHRQ